jgi:hypothetical protein
MFKLRKNLILILSILFLTNNAFSRRRRRRRRRKKKIHLVKITGKVIVKEKNAKTTHESSILDLRFLRKKSYWQFRDPFIILRNYSPLIKNVVVVVFDAKQGALKPEQLPKNILDTKITLKGMGFFPPFKVMYYDSDLNLVNDIFKSVKIYSPGRLINKVLLKPISLPSGEESIYGIRPRDEDTSDANKKSWYYTLKIKDYPSSKGRVLFVKTKFFANVKKDGTFSLPPLPQGKYTLSFIYLNKILPVTKIVEIPKKGSSKPVSIKLTLPILKSEF